MYISRDALEAQLKVLESLMETQERAFKSGYIQALKDEGLLLKDIDEENLETEYRANLYARVFKNYKGGII